MKRIDQILVDLGLARSRSQASEMIKAGQVKIKVEGHWQSVAKPGLKFSEELEKADFEIVSDLNRFASRAGLKLEGALARLNLNVEGLNVLDLGLSTGGFADCLLQKGAAKVVGVDVGHGQLSESLSSNPKLLSVEGVNARELDAEQVNLWFAGERIDLVTMDLSFISLKLIFPALNRILQEGCQVLALVKPQFEVGPENLGKGGLVVDKTLYSSLQAEMQSEAQIHGFVPREYFSSPIEGADGNKEFFLYAEKKSPAKICR